MDWLNYHHLQNFWHVANEGSVQRAADALHVTPATVSIQVRQLERALGVQLFRKQGRNLALTEMGEAVRDYANEIFATGRELLDLVQGRPVGKPLLLRVGIKDVMPKLVAYRLIEPTFEIAEQVRVVCREGPAATLIADLAVHKLDVILSDTPLDQQFKARAYSHLLGESDVLLMATRSLAKELRPGFPGSLTNAPLLLPTENTVLRRSLDEWFHEQQIVPDIRGEFEDSAMLKIAGRFGIGAFAIPAAIQSDVEAMYDVEPIGDLAGLRERFYAVSVERRIRHPAVLAISAGARKRLRSESNRRP